MSAHYHLHSPPTWPGSFMGGLALPEKTGRILTQGPNLLGHILSPAPSWRKRHMVESGIPYTQEEKKA